MYPSVGIHKASPNVALILLGSSTSESGQNILILPHPCLGRVGHKKFVWDLGVVAWGGCCSSWCQTVDPEYVVVFLFSLPNLTACALVFCGRSE